MLRFRSGERISFLSPGLIIQELQEVANIISPFLQVSRIYYDIEILSLAIEEILTNYTKAIAKRIYFQENGLNINNPSDHHKAMKKFQREVIGNWQQFASALREHPYKIWLHLQLIDNNINVCIEGNYYPTLTEQKRIAFRIRNFENLKELNKAYQIFSSANDNIGNESEGTGLGIIVTFNFLRYLKIPVQNLQIKIGDKGFTTTILIPTSRKEKVKDRRQKVSKKDR